MLQIVFEIILSLFAVIGVICVLNEISKIFCFRKKVGKAEIIIEFDKDADKRSYINEILSDRRIDAIIKVPSDSLADFDRTELCDLIEKGKIILF